MSRLHSAVAFLGIFALFFLQGPVIDTLGWAYASHAKSAFTKIHPGIYLYFIAAGLALVDSMVPRLTLNPLLKSWQFLFYVFAVTMLTLRAMTIAASGATAGEQTVALTTFATPILVLISTVRLRISQLPVAATIIRTFFVVNSIMAIVEVLTSHRFFVGYVVLAGLGNRATALCGSPLNGALLTGLIILLLTFGPRRKFPKIWRIPELALHGLAMFAFAGRAAIIGLIVTLVIGAIVLRRKEGEDRLGLFQRMIPFLVLAGGIMLILFPPAFVVQLMDRFNFSGDRSTETRLVIFEIIGRLDTRQLFWGADQSYLKYLYAIYKTPWGIESAWLQLGAVFGFAVAIPLLVSFVLLMLRLTVRLDRSAKLVVLYFMVVTSTSLSIASTSLLVSNLVLMLLTVGDRLGLVAKIPRPARSTTPHGAKLRRPGPRVPVRARAG